MKEGGAGKLGDMVVEGEVGVQVGFRGCGQVMMGLDGVNDIFN